MDGWNTNFLLGVSGRVSTELKSEENEIPQKLNPIIETPQGEEISVKLLPGKHVVRASQNRTSSK